MLSLIDSSPLLSSSLLFCHTENRFKLLYLRTHFLSTRCVYFVTREAEWVVYSNERKRDPNFASVCGDLVQPQSQLALLPLRGDNFLEINTEVEREIQFFKSAFADSALINPVDSFTKNRYFFSNLLFHPSEKISGQSLNFRISNSKF